MNKQPPKTIGSVHKPFSLQINPEYVAWLESQIEAVDDPKPDFPNNTLPNAPVRKRDSDE